MTIDFYVFEKKIKISDEAKQQKGILASQLHKALIGTFPRKRSPERHVKYANWHNDYRTKEQIMILDYVFEDPNLPQHIKEMMDDVKETISSEVGFLA
jgi:hypothetical protein